MYSFLIAGGSEPSKPRPAASRCDGGPVPGQATKQETWLYFHPLCCLQRSQEGGTLDVTLEPFLPQISGLCCFPGRVMKIPTGSILQVATGMATPTKATSGSQWHGRMTEVWAHPLGLEAACRGSDVFPRMGSSPKACTHAGLSPVHTPGCWWVLCSALHLKNVSRS